jgi:ribonuclease R
MPKPGDLVEFTPGLFGLEPPGNLAFYVDRKRVKGETWVHLLTTLGLKEAKADRLKRRQFKARFDGRLDEAGVAPATARLKQFIAQNGGGALAEEAEADLARLEEELWEATCDAGRDDWSDADIAAAWAKDAPSPQQLRDVREALDGCRRAGTGRFQTVAGRGDRWRPWSRAERTRMERAWSDLATLKGKLVRAATADDGVVYTGVPVAEAGLDDRDRATLAWVEPAMRQFVEWDGVPDGAEPVAGIAGLGAVQAFGMDLHRQLAFLAGDWLGGSVSRSSDDVRFLLGVGAWSPEDAVAALTRRHVNQEEFFEHQEDPKAEEAADRFGDPTLEAQPWRTDLRAIPCWTIDPPDAKDFDDAVGLERRGADGADGWRLWVHVADVSAYVTQDSLLDRHARRRATSVYLPGRVLPMLPHRLSDHLCSLRADGDRYALSVSIDLDAAGRIVARAYHHSIIRVTENLSYATALERATAGAAPFADLLAVASLMRAHRNGLELETGELKVLLGDTGFSFLEKRADAATRMIETFMVAANEAVAEHLAKEGVPVLYRCHPLPEPEKAQRFQHQLSAMGLEADLALPRRPAATTAPARMESMLDRLKAGGGKLNLFGGGVSLDDGDDPTAPAAPAPTAPPEPVRLPGFAQLAPDERPKWLAPFQRVVALLSEHKDEELAEVATLKLLGCMGRAFYTPDNEGHFGLASTHYCHFTSPIRRYPDLVVHRNLAWLIGGRKGPAPHAQESLRAMADHCSNQERQAADLERRIKASCLVLAAPEGALGEARLTGITPASLFVVRPDGIEARIPLRDVPGGPYSVDEWESTLGRATDASRLSQAQLLDAARSGALDRPQAVARLGQRVAVRLVARDVAAGRTGAELLSWTATGAAKPPEG